MNPTDTSSPPDLVRIVVEAALDAYRDAMTLGLAETETIITPKQDDEIRALIESARPSAQAVLELARQRIPPASIEPRPNRRQRRAEARAARRGRS